MRTYFFGDIHGNEYALERCLKHLGETGADHVYCLGDIVGWLPFGDRTLQRMRSLALPTVAGNHDLLVAGLFTDHPEQLDRMQATAYNAGLLYPVPGAIDYLAGLPLAITAGDYQTVHHSPFHLPPNAQQPVTIESFNYLDEAALAGCLEDWRNYPKSIIFSGHDHLPAVYELPRLDRRPTIDDVVVHRPKAGEHLTVSLTAGHKYWVKAGSVGGPYRDGIPVCNSVLYDSERRTITLFRLPYATERLHEELTGHRFASNLKTLRNYAELLQSWKAGAADG